jgi:hypothetical protein
VGNFSGWAGFSLVQLYLSGVKVDQKTVEIKAGGEERISFELFLSRAGWIEGEVRLSGDSLPEDDIFYFPLKARERVKVLLVDGDPGRALKKGESYYLVNALNPGGSETSPFLTRVMTEEESAAVDLRPYEALFLLNVARPSGSRLASFLESGKPVFLFLGGRVEPDEYNRLPFFPWRLREIVGGEGKRPERIAWADEKHGALNFLSGPPGESLKKASIYRYFKVEGSTRGLLTLGNQDPLVGEAEMGKGKLFLFAISSNLYWSDLPLKAAYLPLIQNLLKYGIGLSGDTLPATLRIGGPLEGKPTQVSGPTGGPGIYRFSGPRGDGWRGLNPPLEESDLTKLSEAEMQKKFGPVGIKMWEYKEEDWNKALAGKRELWPFLLGFLLTVLAVEMGVASRI